MAIDPLPPNARLGVPEAAPRPRPGPADPAWRRLPGAARAWLLPWLAVLAGVWLAGCRASPLSAPPTVAPSVVAVSIRADGDTRSYDLAPGLTVREAVAHAGLSLGELDRLSPPPYTVVTDGLAISIVRVTENFETEHAVLPYSSETIKNEALPDGERRILQLGQNGEEEITYRTVFEDGVQVSRGVVRRVTMVAPVPEIIMMGTQGSFTLVPISGTLAYLNGRNAWVMRGNSGQRLPLTTSGDLDGRVFDLSPDGQWLLFTRSITEPEAPQFNTLWAIPTAPTATVPITRSGVVTRSTRPVTPTSPISTSPVAMGLPVSNVLYAEWSPLEPDVIAYSTAEKISRAPGWQANNDLWLLRWDTVGRQRQRVFTPTQLLDSSSGGVYGWWGTGYAFSPDGASLAYARTDAIGLVNFAVYTPSYTATAWITELRTFTAFNSHGDWAWFPDVRWSPDGQFLFTTVHGAPMGLEAPEDSPAFDLLALSVPVGQPFTLVRQAGMFANPAPSPAAPGATGEASFSVAFLQASDPGNSPFSTYRLGLMDRDGSNARLLFPAEGEPGLNANESVAWSPDGRRLAVTYSGNLWLLEPESGLAQQLTGDGLSAHPRWRP